MNEVNFSDLDEFEASDRLYTFEQAATLTAISVQLVERFVTLNVVEAKGKMLRSQELTRIAQIIRLRRDLGLNWVGASMVLDMAQELAQLRARLRAYEDHIRD